MSVKTWPVMGTVIKTRGSILLAACLVAIALLALGSAPAHAAACDTSWASAISGNWNDATKWTAGSPDSTKNACITVGGASYTVSIPGIAASAKSLTLGASSGTATQTVQIQATDFCGGPSDGSLTLANGGSVTGDGIIDLTHVGGCGNGIAHLIVSGGTLTSAGTVQTDLGTANGGSPPRLNGNITNSGGTININTGTNYDADQSGGTLDNAGTINLANNQQLTVIASSSSTVTNDTAGSITNGTGNGDLFVDSGNNSFIEAAGTTSPSTPNPASPAVYIHGATLNYTGTGASTIVARGAGVLTGNLASGQNLVIQSTDFCGGPENATATINTSLTNAGNITLSHTGSCGNGTDFLEVGSGQTLTNTGTIETDLGTGNGSNPPRLDGNITNSGGTININTSTRYGESATGTLSNGGAIKLADSQVLTVVPGHTSTITNGSGGSIVNSTDGTAGTLFVDSGNTFNQGAGTTTPNSANPANPAVVLHNSTLNYTGSGASAVAFRGGGALSGNLASGQNLVIDATDFCGGPEDATATAGASFTNAGSIILTQIGSCGNGRAHLTISAGTLTNSGTLETDLGTHQNSSNPPGLNGNITNSGGTININTTTQYDFDQAGGTLDNAGKLSIANGQNLFVPHNTVSTITNDTGGSITNNSGTGYLYVDTANTFNENGGTTSPSSANPANPAVYVHSSALHYGAAGASSIVARGAGTLSGNLASGQNLVIQSTDFCGGSEDSNQTAGASFTNAGSIILTQVGGCGNGRSRLTISSGTMTNTGTLETDLGTNQNSSNQPYLNGNITNSGGTININENTQYDTTQNNGTLDNGGTINLNNNQLYVPVNTGSIVTNDAGGSITNNSGTGNLFVDNGNTFNQKNGTISPSSAVPKNPAVFVRNSTLNYTGTGKGTLAFRGTGALNGNLGSGQNLIIQGTDFCGGSEDANANAPGSFTNMGTITLSHAGTCGNGHAFLNIGGGGTLTNKGTLSGQLGAGGNVPKDIVGTVTSNGTITVGKGATLVLNGTLTNFATATNTLTGGTYALTGTFQYINAGFVTSGIVNDGAKITLSGGSFIDQNSASALRNLASIASQSLLALSGNSSLPTAGGLSNAGTVSIAGGSTLTVGGNYTQSSTGTWGEGITSTSNYGLMHVSGNSTLGGTLAISAPKTFNGSNGSVLTPLTAASNSGTFSTITGAGPGTAGKYFAIAYTATSFTLTVHTATMTLTPNSGAPSSGFTVTGTGWAPGETVTIKFGTTTLTPATADGSGNISQAETVPMVAAGNYTVTGTGQTSQANVAQAFTVT